MGEHTTDPPAAEHLCIAILILEGAVQAIASANWDGFIEAAVERLSNGVPGVMQSVRGQATVAQASDETVTASVRHTGRAVVVHEAAGFGGYGAEVVARVTEQCFHDALDKILLGAERPLVLSEADVNVIAYHEGGHALTGLLLDHGDPVSKVTIVPRGQALGVTQYTPLDDRYNYSQEYLEAQLVTALGGRGAEEVALGSITTGAENDLQRVTAIARQMVTCWGMSERLGTISYSEREDPFVGGTLATGARAYSEQTASIIDEEVNRIVKRAYERAVSLLVENRATLDRIARALRVHETLDAEQLRAILEETGVLARAAA